MVTVPLIFITIWIIPGNCLQLKNAEIYLSVVVNLYRSVLNLDFTFTRVLMHYLEVYEEFTLYSFSK